MRLTARFNNLTETLWAILPLEVQRHIVTSSKRAVTRMLYVNPWCLSFYRLSDYAQSLYTAYNKFSLLVMSIKSVYLPPSRVHRPFYTSDVLLHLCISVKFERTVCTSSKS